MLDVKAVMDGTFVCKSLGEALEASVFLQNEQERIAKGTGNVFGYIVEFAREHAIEWHNKQDAINEKGVLWYQVAADCFKVDADSEIAQGSARGFTDAQMKNFRKYATDIYNAMSLGAPLHEKGEDGEYVLGGKSAIEKWARDKREAEQQAQRDRSRVALEAQGRQLEKVHEGGSGGKAETIVYYSFIDDIDDEDAREALQEYIDVYVQAYAKVKGRDGMVEHLTGSTLSHVGRLKKVLATLVDQLTAAAANDAKVSDDDGDEVEEATG